MADNLLPDLSKDEAEKIVEAYADVYQQSVSLSSAFIKNPILGSSSSRIILTEWTQRNLILGVNTKIQRTLLCDESFKSAINVNTEDVSNRLMVSFSKSERFKAVVNKNPKDKMRPFLEIWNDEKCLHMFELSILNQHGNIYDDEMFGCMSWSPSDEEFAYVAEKIPPESTAFYPQKPQKETSGEKHSPTMGIQHKYTDDWGEQMTPKTNPVICICNIKNMSIKILEGVPEDSCPGQVIWEPSGNGIVGMIVKNQPRRLGLKFCMNRQWSIFHITSDWTYTTLSDTSRSAFSPRFSPDGKYLIWLDCDVFGPHMNNMALMKCDWHTKKIETLIGMVDDVRLTKNGKPFHGIYSHRLSDKCWSSDSNYIIFESLCKNKINVYAVDVRDGCIFDLNPYSDESLSFLHISDDDYVACSKSSFRQPSTLVAFHLPSVIENGLKNFNDLLEIKEYENYCIEDFVVTDLETNNARCTATYVGPNNGEKNSTPLILLVHGGPHGAISNWYVPVIHLYSNLNFGTLIVHYSGSLGFGKKFVESILGNAGSIEVKDCFAATKNALNRFPWLDKNNVILTGGSHGGYVVSHMMGQYPNDFVATLSRNPVTNLLAMLYVSDIPDWCVVEAGYIYKGLSETVDDKELRDKFANMSPIKYIKNVKTPTLLAIGKNDLRVPPSQGISYYNMLKEMNVPTKLLLYDDNHSISGISSEMDRCINDIIWIKRCMKQKKDN